MALNVLKNIGFRSTTLNVHVIVMYFMSRNDMESLSTSLALCEGIHRSPVDYLAKVQQCRF